MGTHNIGGADERTVGREVPMCQEKPKETPNSQVEPDVERKDQEVPYAPDTGVPEKIQEVSEADQLLQKPLDCQEVPDNSSGMVKEQTEAMDITKCVNKPVKSVECLENPEEASTARGEKANGKQDQEPVGKKLKEISEHQEGDLEKPKETPNSQVEPDVERKDQKVPYAPDMGVPEKIQEVSEAGQLLQNPIDCQEVPQNASGMVKEQTEAMDISKCVNELVKGVECLENPEEASTARGLKANGKQDQEPVGKNFGEHQEGELEKTREDQAEKSEHYVNAVHELEDRKEEERKEDLKGGEITAKDQMFSCKVKNMEEDFKKTTEQNCAANLETNARSTGWKEESSGELGQGEVIEDINKTDRSVDNKLTSVGKIETPKSEANTTVSKSSSESIVREDGCNKPDDQEENRVFSEMETGSSEQTPLLSTKSEETNPTTLDETHMSMPEDSPAHITPSLAESCMEGSDTHLNSDITASEDLNVKEHPDTSNEALVRGIEESAVDHQKEMEQILAEISTHLSEKDVQITPLLGNYSEFAETPVEHGRFGHIIEVYGFSSKLSAEDLMEPFQEYRERGFRLHWVDQTHALAIFSSPEEAYAASRKTHPDMKFRPLSQASRQSKIRAYDKAASLQPPRDRPHTDASVAKRMVNRALGQPRCGPEQPVTE